VRRGALCGRRRRRCAGGRGARRCRERVRRTADLRSVPGPWVVVPASTSSSRVPVEYQLTCPRGHIVAGLDARLSVAGSTSNSSGSSEAREPWHLDDSLRGVRGRTWDGRTAHRRSSRSSAASLRRGGSRVPTSVTAFRPGQPVTRRVRDVRVRRDDNDRPACASASASWWHARLRVRDPEPAEREPRLQRVRLDDGREQRRQRSRHGDAEIAGVRAVVQVQALCARSR
jgi:hypothetical protein